MAQEEVLRMVAAARDQASGPLRKVENALRGVGKQGADQSKQLRENFKTVHEQFRKVGDVARESVSPAMEAMGVSALSAVGAVTTLVAGLKSFVDQGDDVAAFGRRVKLTTDTIRGLEGVADKFHVDPAAIRQGEQTFTDAMYQIRRRRGEVYAHMLAQRRDLATELSSTPETTEGNEKALKSFLKVLEDVKKVHGEATARAFSKEVFGTDAFVDLLRKGNVGLEEAAALTLKLRGNMDTEASEKWVSNWSDFKATIEGVRNVVGNDLLPDLTSLAKQAQEFFSEHKAEIGRNIADSVREIGSALHGLNDGVQAVGGWKTVFEGLLALKLVGLAINIGKVAGALGRFALITSPPKWILSLLGVGAAEVVGGGIVGAGIFSAYHAGSKDEGPILGRMSQLRSQVNVLEEIADRKSSNGDLSGAATTRSKISALNDELTQLTQKLKEVQDAPPSAGGSGFGQGIKSIFGGLYDRGGRRHLGKYLDGHHAVSGNAAEIIQGLRDRNLDSMHAAILGGNIEQESGFDPTRPNVAEGGIGLIQWNKERRVALQAFAAQRHKLETDAGTQLDFMMKELNDTPQGRAFLAAQSPEEMNRALHSHIRYGDNSEGTRMAYGRNLLPLAERTQPGSLLAAAGKSGAMGGGSSTVTGSASLTVDVKAPRGTSVRAEADGLFKSVDVNRGLSMPRASEQD
jgi:hypothetical protein